MRIEDNRRRKEMYKAHKLIAKNLRLLRSIRGLSQEKVADLLNMSRSCYSALENGSKIPDFMTVYTLSRFYDVSLDYLLAFDISDHLLSLIRSERINLDSFAFLDNYMWLSYGARWQIRDRICELLEEERSFNHFPWDYSGCKEEDI